MPSVRQARTALAPHSTTSGVLLSREALPRLGVQSVSWGLIRRTELTVHVAVSPILPEKEQALHALKTAP